jgi:hypothetical protein
MQCAGPWAGCERSRRRSGTLKNLEIEACGCWKMLVSRAAAPGRFPRSLPLEGGGNPHKSRQDAAQGKRRILGTLAKPWRW